MYKLLIRPLLFLIAPERIHRLTFNLLKFTSRVGFSPVLKTAYTFHHPQLVRELMGLRFKNPVGLAAGFDKDAKEIDELAALGFGFIEIGTLTPKPQTGNAVPRLFRLPLDNALINRMGFNNEGVEAAVVRLKKSKADVLIGGNIGKNKDTPNERAVDDYSYCFETLYPYVDYFVVNVSSPNTPNLRDLQEKEPLRKLLTQVKNLSRAKEKPKPVLLKISPDLTASQLDDVIAILRETNTDGVIATNTTLSRDGLSTNSKSVDQMGAGGLSGGPLAKRSNEIIAYLRKELGKDYPIIGVGGILSPGDALDKFKAGADLIQVYTGFIYEGPGFVKKILKEYLKNGTATASLK